jgi:subtilisin family serine protease
MTPSPMPIRKTFSSWPASATPHRARLRPWSPSTVPLGVIGVGGLDKNGRVLDDSTAPGTAVDLMGPAKDIPIPYYSGGYAEGQGCSFASPIVSGAAALIRSDNPKLTADEVRAKLQSSAKPVAGHKAVSTEDKPDPTVGWGRLDPQAALKAKVPGKVVSAETELADWVKMHRRGEAKAKETETAAPDESESPRAVAPTDIAASQSTPIFGFAVPRRRRPGHACPPRRLNRFLRSSPPVNQAGGTALIWGVLSLRRNN